MAVFRVEKTEDYTIMSNYHLRDKNLSLKAKGLLSWMLSNSDDWDYTVAGIVANVKESRDAVNSALCELEDYGYLTRRQIREGGKFGDMEYLITEKPFTENPITVNPITEKPQQRNTNINKELNKRNKSLSKDKEEQAPKKSYNDIFSAKENEVIRDALVKWINVCKGRNYNPKVTTVEDWAKLLRDNAGNDKDLAMAIVQQSIDKQWKSIFPLKKGYTPVKKDAISIPTSKEDKAKKSDGSYVVY